MKCHMMKGALEAEGIACFIKNEFGEGGGEIGEAHEPVLGPCNGGHDFESV